MELRHIRYFLAVAEEENFTRAAARLGVGQPPVSSQIRDLENELGAPLFHRVPGGAELTEAGKAFLIEARSILAGADRARIAAQRAHRGQSGILSLGLTGSAPFDSAVIATIRKFREHWPDALLSLAELSTLAMLESLRREDLDAAFIRPGRGEIEDLRLHRFADEPMVVAIPPRHRLARKQKVYLVEFANEPFVMFPPASTLSLHHEVMMACQSCGFVPKVSQIVPQISSALSLVAAGFGVAAVPQCVAKIRVPGVTYRAIDGPAPLARLALATRREREHVVLRNFISVMRATMNRASAVA